MGPKIYYGTILDRETHAQLSLDDQQIRKTLRDQFYDNLTSHSDADDQMQTFQPHVREYQYQMHRYMFIADTVALINQAQLQDYDKVVLSKYLLVKLLLFFASQTYISLKNNINIFQLEEFL